jgi:putative GTP pyrophosphokinase
MSSLRCDLAELEDWYNKCRPKFEGLANVVASILSSLLDTFNIEYLAITQRTKNTIDILEKSRRKGYKNPKIELTDFAGIRIVTYFESQVDQISNIIRKTFIIDEDNSMDKSKLLGIDKIGYRSVHFVCKLGSDRTVLPELSQYMDLAFEVQVRTVLQHAWAEVAHDRTYKFSGSLPPETQRRLHLISGLLEMADGEFDRLSADIDKYAKEVKEKTEANELEEIDINTTSLIQYLYAKFKKDRWWLEPIEPNPKTVSDYDEVISELKQFGIRNMEEIDTKLLTKDFISKSKAAGKTTFLGVLRDAMMYCDLEKYLKDCWQEHWTGTEESLCTLLSQKYDINHIRQSFAEYGIEILHDDQCPPAELNEE